MTIDPITARGTLDAAQELLERLAGPDAVLRPDQGTAIEALVDGRARVLVVQRTGWGKSAVYFVATRLLRERGAGPTLLVSPLLALMRDQILAAERAGIHAATINSSNIDAWTEVEASVVAGEVDLLLISPERLNNPRFREEILPRLTAGIGMLVVDEVHCISDWGHQFRPDYRRVRDVLDDLGDDVPVLACTATANDRVVADVTEQLGSVDVALRGSLDRSSLRLAVVHQPDAAHRLAWLASFVASRNRPGIVYTLTVAETDLVAEWLSSRGVPCAAYSSQVPPDERERIEERLRADELRAVVATSSLGMGYDHPRLGWLVHLGAPDSPVAYYQAVGRAGRAVDDADVVLVPGAADERIWDYFDRTALPDPDQVDQLLAALPTGGAPMSVPQLETVVPARRTRIEALLKVLDVDGAVTRVKGGYLATGQPWQLDVDRVTRVREARAAERQAMRDYRDGRIDCRMAFLRSQLDDPDVEPCGRCDLCTGRAPEVTVDDEVVQAAWSALRGQEHVITPRKMWPPGLDAVHRGDDLRGRISSHRRAAEGRALAFGDDPGWGEAVRAVLDGNNGSENGSDEEGDAFEEVVGGLVDVLAGWDWDDRPTWVTWVPSSSGDLAERLARRIGATGRLTVLRSLERVGSRSQDPRANSVHQAANALAGYRRAAELTTAPRGPVLLVDTTRSSGWTLTVAAWLLTASEGVGPVLPLVLHTLP